METTEIKAGVIMVKFMKDVYSFIKFAGFANCDRCDTDTMVNEYNRHDGVVVVFCTKCEDRLEL